MINLFWTFFWATFLYIGVYVNVPAVVEIGLMILVSTHAGLVPIELAAKRDRK